MINAEQDLWGISGPSRPDRLELTTTARYHLTLHVQGPRGLRSAALDQRAGSVRYCLHFGTPCPTTECRSAGRGLVVSCSTAWCGSDCICDRVEPGADVASRWTALRYQDISQRGYCSYFLSGEHLLRHVRFIALSITSGDMVNYMGGALCSLRPVWYS